MILTVTLNLAIDKAYTVDRFAAGEVTRVREARYTAGGKGLNVTRIISVLGAPVLATGFSAGYAGQFIQNELDKLNIAYDFVSIAGETRSCINVIDLSQGRQTELLEPGPAVTGNDVERFIDKYHQLMAKSDIVTISGSAPRGVGTDIYPGLVRMAKSQGKMVVLDSSGALLKEGIKAAPTLVKPNVQEAQDLLGVQIRTVADAKTAARELVSMGVEMAAISLGRDGAVLADRMGNTYYAKPEEIKAVNTVGCGDAMIGGFAVGLARGYGLDELLRIGVAASAASAMVMETGHCRLDDVKKIIPTLDVQRSCS
jgi:tagatose 6-phosphate kinase